MATLIKICGLTRPSDVALACSLGADAVGFVLVPSSKRCVSARDVRRLVAGADRKVLTVGVIANMDIQDAVELCGEVGMTAMQLHGQESVAYARELIAALPRVKVYKAFHVRSAADLEQVATWDGIVDAVLIDSGGGSGEPFDWSLRDSLPALSTPVIVAGGLTPSNVRAAIDRFTPWGVDVASGVEARPGIKDPALLSAFFKAVRATEGHETT